MPEISVLDRIITESPLFMKNANKLRQIHKMM